MTFSVRRFRTARRLITAYFTFFLLCFVLRATAQGRDFLLQPYFQIQHSNDIEAVNVSINLLNDQFYREVSTRPVRLTSRMCILKNSLFLFPPPLTSPSEHSEGRPAESATRRQPPTALASL